MSFPSARITQEQNIFFFSINSPRWSSDQALIEGLGTKVKLIQGLQEGNFAVLIRRSPALRSRSINSRSTRRSRKPR